MERLNERARIVVNEYRGLPYILGTTDCNLMILKIFNAELHDLLKGTYSTIKNGVSSGLDFSGCKSLREYLRQVGFKLIQKERAMPLDIIVFRKTHNVYLNLGSVWFGVDNSHHFGVVNPKDYDGKDYLIYRWSN